MQRKILFASVVTLLAVTLLLGIRLYQTTQQLDKAEQYMMSGTVSWVGACGGVAGNVRSPDPSEVRRAANFVRNHCVSASDWPTVERLLATGDPDGALRFVTKRLYEHRIPRILERGSYNRSSFPPGYP